VEKLPKNVIVDEADVSDLDARQQKEASNVTGR
jgi:hypothetical protein